MEDIKFCLVRKKLNEKYYVIFWTPNFDWHKQNSFKRIRIEYYAGRVKAEVHIWLWIFWVMWETVENWISCVKHWCGRLIAVDWVKLLSWRLQLPRCTCSILKTLIETIKHFNTLSATNLWESALRTNDSLSQKAFAESESKSVVLRHTR